jgi:head-tail adaptor
VLITQVVKELNVSESEAVEHFVKKHNKANSLAKQEDVKSNAEMTEGKNEISVRHMHVITDGLRHKYALSCRPVNHSRFNEKSNVFV